MAKAQRMSHADAAWLHMDQPFHAKRHSCSSLLRAALGENRNPARASIQAPTKAPRRLNRELLSVPFLRQASSKQ
jgi:hypothetical protein